MIATASPESIAQAAKLLRSGGLVAFPTETVYGLGALATDNDAVERIFRVKGRPEYNPLIVHLATLSQVFEITAVTATSELGAQVQRLASLWPGPLSLVVPRGPVISSIVAGGGDSIAVRIPNHPVALRLLSEVGAPIAAPSANRSTYVSPTTAAHVEQELGTEIGMILDGGPCPIGVESTVLSLVERVPTIVRPGAISRREIEERLGCAVAVRDTDSVPPAVGALPSPGMLAAHYAPHTRIIVRGAVDPAEYPERVGLIAFSTEPIDRDPVEYAAVHTLSFQGDLHEVAANLYSAVRAQDEMELDLIVIDPRGAEDLFSEEGRQRALDQGGLGLAVIDRITRATARFRS